MKAYAARYAPEEFEVVALEKTFQGPIVNPAIGAALAHPFRRVESPAFCGRRSFCFPACERNRFDPNKPRKTGRTAWRSLVQEVANEAGEDAAKRAESARGDSEVARARAMEVFIGANGTRLRFHDLRHQAIAEFAETRATDATMMALAGHMSREMLEHYSHVRMAAKREALDKLPEALN